MSKNEARGSCRKNNHGRRWTREVWPCRRWSLCTPARWSSRQSEQCGLTGARLGKWGGWRGRGRRGGALGGVARLGTWWRGRESSPNHDGACRERRRRKWEALGVWMVHLRRPGGVWHSSGRVGANWLGRHWRTPDRWPDTRWQVKLYPTESMTDAHDCSDWNPIFVDVSLDGFCSDLFQWVELHKFYKFA